RLRRAWRRSRLINRSVAAGVAGRRANPPVRVGQGGMDLHVAPHELVAVIDVRRADGELAIAAARRLREGIRRLAILRNPDACAVDVRQLSSVAIPIPVPIAVPVPSPAGLPTIFQ